MKIGIDVDGVLTDFEWFLDYYAPKLLRNVVINKDEYKFEKRFSCLSRDEVFFYVRYLWKYINKMPIREGAATVIKMLRDEGHKVYIITARIGATKKNAFGRLMRRKLREWLSRNGVVYDGIYYVSTHDSAREKTSIARKLQLDYFIEDDPENITSLQQVCEVISIITSYNYKVKAKQALDFQEAYQIIGNKHMSLIPHENREKFSKAVQKTYFTKVENYYREMPFDIHFYNKKKRGYNNVIKVLGGAFARSINLKVKDSRKLKGAESAIYVCNHRRSLDIAIGYYLLKRKHPRLLIKYEYLGSPLGKLLDYMGSVFVDRSSRISGKRAQNILIRNILNGGSILLYPEGTRNKTSEPLLSFKYGAVYISQVTSAPIVPIVINKISKRKYEVIVGDKFVVSKDDDLTVKKNELQKYMCDRINIQYKS